MFRVEKMDCAAEEHLVRMGLDGLDGVRRLAFDLPARRVAVFHEGNRAPIRTALDGLGLGASEVEHEVDVDEDEALLEGDTDSRERGPLAVALAITAALFAGEMAAGLIGGSMGLVADSLDNLADASVYALSLAVVGHAATRKKRVARWSGYLQLSLAVFGLVEVVRRFFGAEGAPDVATMVVVSGIALVGNVAVLRVLRTARGGPGEQVHVEASEIFTSNDVKVNALVIAAGALVWATSSQVPDLLAGALIFVIVANGARRILALSR